MLHNDRNTIENGGGGKEVSSTQCVNEDEWGREPYCFLSAGPHDRLPGEGGAS